MRLSISHRTVYRYDHAPFFSAQVIRLTPRTNISQQIMRWRIETAGSLSPWTDAFGNACHTLVLDDVPHKLEIHAYGEVLTNDTQGVLPGEPGELPLEVFLRQTGQTKPDAAMADFARSFADPMRANRIAGLHDMMLAIRDRVEYELGITHALSTAPEAFAHGHGVCQDHAHIFIGCARLLGIPARYVSGYLYDGENHDPHTAGHAWAAAWVDDLGWVAFDISNCIAATDDHVSIAVGLDYDTASPVRGVRTGGTESELLDVAVHVSAAQQ